MDAMYDRLVSRVGRSMISLGLIMVGAILLGASAAASAQPYPTKPVRLVVGWPPGGAADGAARPLATKLSEVLGRQVLIDNRPGATGTIGASIVAKGAGRRLHAAPRHEQ